MAARRTSSGTIRSLPRIVILVLLLLVTTTFPFAARGFSLPHQQHSSTATTPGLLLYRRIIIHGNERNTRHGNVSLWNSEKPDHGSGADPPPHDGAVVEDTLLNTEKFNTVFRRFTDPVIDDPGLPLTDALVAQIIAPSLQIAWLSAWHAPRPTWLQPIVNVDLLYSSVGGALVAPTLLHGAALASCWLAGALAARAYERASISPQKSNHNNNNDPLLSEWDYRPVGQAVLRAGAFATGLLILATQLDLFLEFHGQWIQLGESEETDFRLLVAAVELMNDVVFEAVALVAWRLVLAYQTERWSRNDDDDTYY